MKHFFKPTEKDLTLIKARDLSEGYIFWIKQDNGEFHKAVVDLDWYKKDSVLNAYKAGLRRLSVENKLYTRRDKPGQDFRDLL